MSRFTYLDRPQALPGVCVICGSGNAQGYIDTQRSFEWYGAVYCCNNCVEEMFATLAFRGQHQEVIPGAIIGEVKNTVKWIEEFKNSVNRDLSNIGQHVAGIYAFLSSASDAISKTQRALVESIGDRASGDAGVVAEAGTDTA